MWGDMLAIGDKIYTLDSDGEFQQIYGKSTKPDRYPGDSAPNNDGRKSSCVEIALNVLHVDATPVRKFKKKRGEDTSVPIKLIEKLFATGWTELPLQDNPVGVVILILARTPHDLFIVCGDQNSRHAFAITNGTVHNIKFNSLTDRVLRVWKKDVVTGD